MEKGFEKAPSGLAIGDSDDSGFVNLWPFGIPMRLHEVSGDEVKLVTVARELDDGGHRESIHHLHSFRKFRSEGLRGEGFRFP